MDLEQQMADTLDGCFFVFTEEGRVRNRGKKQISKSAMSIGTKLEFFRPPAAPAVSAAGVPSVSEIVETVAGVAVVTVGDIRGRSRRQQVIRARQAAVRLTYILTGQSLKWVGKKFGLDHSTVLHTLAMLSPEASSNSDKLLMAAADHLMTRYPHLLEIMTAADTKKKQRLGRPKRHECQAG